MSNFELIILIGVVLVGIISIANSIILYLNKDKYNYSDDYSEDVIEIHKELKESINKANKKIQSLFQNTRM